MSTHWHTGRAARGFTLVEMVVVIVIAGVLATTGATLMSSGFRNYFLGRELAQDSSEGSLALERMTRELRNIRSATAADLPTMGAATISFIDASGTSISYALSGTSVTRTENAGTPQPLIANVSNLAFSYLKSDGVNTAATQTEVWYVTVAVTVTSKNVSMTFRGTVKPVSL